MIRCFAWHGATNSSSNAYLVLCWHLMYWCMPHGWRTFPPSHWSSAWRATTSPVAAVLMLMLRQRWKMDGNLDEWGYFIYILYIYIWAGDLPNHFPLSFQGPRQKGDWWGRKWAECVLLLLWFWGQDCIAFASSIVYGLKINQSRASSDSRNKNRPFFVTLASPKSSG